MPSAGGGMTPLSSLSLSRVNSRASTSTTPPHDADATRRVETDRLARNREGYSSRPGGDYFGSSKENVSVLEGRRPGLGGKLRKPDRVDPENIVAIKEQDANMEMVRLNATQSFVQGLSVVPQSATQLNQTVESTGAAAMGAISTPRM